MDTTVDLDTWVSLAALLGALVTFYGLTSRQIGDLKDELRSEIRGLRTEMCAGFQSLDHRVRAEIQGVRTDIKALDDRVCALATGLHLPTGPTEAAARASPTDPARRTK